MRGSTVSPFAGNSAIHTVAVTNAMRPRITSAVRTKRRLPCSCAAAALCGRAPRRHLLARLALCHLALLHCGEKLAPSLPRPRDRPEASGVGGRLEGQADL